MGVAVKVTLLPEQIVLCVAAILTVGVEFGTTVMLMALEVTLAVVAQSAVECIWTLTELELSKADVE